MWIPFTNWSPDLAPTEKGILLDPSNQFIPTIRGYRNATDLTSLGIDSLTATGVGIWYAHRTDGTANLYAGTPGALWLRSSLSWVTAVGATTISAVTRWQFAQVGDITFAGAKETQSLISDTTTFTSIASMPRYAMIDVANEFVMIGNVSVSRTYSDAAGLTVVTAGDYPDRWWCSGIGNPLTWEPNIATQCTTGRLTDMPGPLTAGRALGDRFVFYKQRGIWLGENTSVPFVWEFSCISKEIGTHCQQSVVVIGDLHYFIGNDDIYVFDGQRATSIGFGMREWFFANVDKKHLPNIWGVPDRYNKLIFWWYPAANGTGLLTDFIVYHYPSGKWGRGQVTITAANEAFADDLIYDRLWTAFTFDTTPNTTFDNIAPGYNSYVPIVFSSLKVLSYIDGPAKDSTIVTTFGGDDTRASILRRIRARWIKEPPTATLTPYRLMRQGENPGTGTTRNMHNARWDFTQNARWHQIKINPSGYWECAGVDAEVYVRGRE